MGFNGIECNIKAWKTLERNPIRENAGSMTRNDGDLTKISGAANPTYFHISWRYDRDNTIEDNPYYTKSLIIDD